VLEGVCSSFSNAAASSLKAVCFIVR
jgi:hypothetical protein